MISKRISDICCDSNHLNKASADYNAALRNSGFNKNISDSPRQSRQRKRKR